jgi:hypothetical protein
LDASTAFAALACLMSLDDERTKTVWSPYQGITWTKEGDHWNINCGAKVNNSCIDADHKIQVPNQLP